MNKISLSRIKKLLKLQTTGSGSAFTKAHKVFNLENLENLMEIVVQTKNK